MNLAQLIAIYGTGFICLAVAIIFACRKCYLNGVQDGEENSAKWQKLIRNNSRNQP